MRQKSKKVTAKMNICKKGTSSTQNEWRTKFNQNA